MPTSVTNVGRPFSVGGRTKWKTCLSREDEDREESLQLQPV